MSLIVRADGSIWCAAKNERREDDHAYIDDAGHYYLSVVAGIIQTEPHELHEASGGRWWWHGDPDKPETIDPFYTESRGNPPGLFERTT